MGFQREIILLVLLSFDVLYVENADFFQNMVEREYKMAKEFKGYHSRFGYSMLYSKEFQKLYVSDPGAVNSQAVNISLGAVYSCDINDKTGNCAKNFPVPFEKDVRDNFGPISGLFGISMDLNSNKELAICGPNLPYMSTLLNHYCYAFAESGAPSPPTKEIMRVIISGGRRSVQNYGVIFRSLQETGKKDYLIGKRVYTYMAYPETSAGVSIFMTKFVGATDASSYLTIKAIPTFKILLNSIFDAQMRYIITYTSNEAYLGSFEMFDSGDNSVQYIVNKAGSVGQFFGYDGLFEDINNDQCSDVIITAPYYNDVLLEGAAFYFACDETKKQIKAEAIMLLGDNLPNNKFGMSITSLGSINEDPYTDVAILASRSKDVGSALFIYLGTEEGISTIYSQVVKMVSTSSDPILAYNLLGKVDYSGDDVDDIVMSNAAQNKVFTMRGIKYTKISYEMKNNKVLYVHDVEELCKDETETSCDLVFIDELNICFELSYTIPSTYDGRPYLTATFQINKPDLIQFITNDKLESELTIRTELTAENPKPCPIIPIRIKVNPKLVGLPFNLLFTAEVLGLSPTGCYGSCLAPDGIKVTEQMSVEFPKCNKGGPCVSKYGIEILSTDSNELPNLAVSVRKLSATITNIGTSSIYWTTLYIVASDAITVTLYSINNRSDILRGEGMVKNTAEKRGVTSYRLELSRTLIVNKFFTLYVEMSIYPIMADSDKATLSITAIDAYATTDSGNVFIKKFEYSVKDIHELQFYQLSSPETIVIKQSKDSNSTKSIPLYLTIEANNLGPSPILLPYFVISVPVQYNKQDILVKGEVTISTGVEEVTNDEYFDYSTELFTYQERIFRTKILNANQKVTITLKFDVETLPFLVNSNNLTYIQTHFTGYQEDDEGNRIVIHNFTLNTYATIFYGQPKRKQSFIPLIVAVILAIMLLAVILGLLAKFKVFQKLQFQAPPPGQEAAAAPPNAVAETENTEEQHQDEPESQPEAQPEAKIESRTEIQSETQEIPLESDTDVQP